MLSIYAVPVDATTFCGLCRFVTPLTRAKDPTMTAPKKQSSQNAFMFPTSPCEVPEFHHFQTCIASWLNRSQFGKKTPKLCIPAGIPSKNPPSSPANVAPPSHNVRPVTPVPSLGAGTVVVLRLDGGARGQQRLDHLAHIRI